MNTRRTFRLPSAAMAPGAVAALITLADELVRGPAS